VVAIAGSLEIDGEALAEALETQVVKERLKAEVSAAIERGVFGSPTFIVDGEMFWGADRLWQIKRWIEQGGW
jgi:2-hydroxychromene-2-carboxylate isomerase